MDLKLQLMMAMVIWKKMIICVRGSVYDVDAGVATSLSYECIYDVALSWAKSVKIWMLDDNDEDGDVGASESDFLMLKAALSPHGGRFVAFFFVAGRRWRRRFLPWLFIAVAGAAVLSSVLSSVLAPLSMKRGAVAVSGPQAMIEYQRMAAAIGVLPVN